MERCASAQDKVWARTQETGFKCTHSLCARAAYIRAHASGFVREQRKSAREQGDSRASREIRAQAGRFALAHYINLLSRYKNALSTFGSKITPYHCLGGFVFKCATHGIRCSSAGGYQTALQYCGRPLLDWGGIACIRRKASCTEPRGPYRDGSVRIHVPCHPYCTHYLFLIYLNIFPSAKWSTISHN